MVSNLPKVQSVVDHPSVDREWNRADMLGEEVMALGLNETQAALNSWAFGARQGLPTGSDLFNKMCISLPDFPASLFSKAALQKLEKAGYCEVVGDSITT